MPFSTWSTAAELDFLLQDSGVRYLFTLARFGERDFAGDVAALRARGAQAQLEKVILIDAAPQPGFETGFEAYASYREGEALAALPPGLGASAADTLVILYTSGSSNRPKAVPLDHFAVIENGFNIGERQGLVAGDRVLVAVPLFWSYGAVNALPATVTHGATLVLQGRFEPGEALDLIERHACTAIYTLPAMTNALLAHPAFAAATHGVVADRRHHRRTAGRHQGRNAAGCRRDLQHLWRHGGLRQLLRHAPSLAARAARELSGAAAARRARAHSRSRDGRERASPARSGRSRSRAI